MIYNIIPKHDKNRSCFWDEIVSILIAYGHNNYQLMYSKCFFFNFNNFDANKLLGQKISCGLGDIYNLIERYTNVRIESKLINRDSINIYIYNQLVIKRCPITILVDSYYCCWAEAYMKRHDNHHISIIKKINDKEILINDSYNEKNILLNLSDINVMFSGEILIYHNLKNKTECIIDINNIYNDCYNSYINQSSSQNLMLLIQELSSINFRNEINNENKIFRVPLYQSFFKYSQNSFNLSNMFMFLYEKFNFVKLKSLNAQFNQVGSNFHLICLLISKDFHKESTQLTKIDKIKKILNEINQLQEEICSNLNISNNDKSSNSYEQQFINDIYFINIDTYVNNKAFGGSINSMGDYFLSKKLLSMSLFNYKFNIKLNEKFDNIVCDNQIIELKINKNYNNLFIIGCCVYGSYIKNCKIIYCDDSEQLSNIRLSDWYSEAFFDDFKIWSGDMKGFDENDNAFNNECNIFACNINLKNKIKKIVLPKCENMHIFSIVLTK